MKLTLTQTYIKKDSSFDRTIILGAVGIWEHSFSMFLAFAPLSIINSTVHKPTVAQTSDTQQWQPIVSCTSQCFSYYSSVLFNQCILLDHFSVRLGWLKLRSPKKRTWVDCYTVGLLQARRRFCQSTHSVKILNIHWKLFYSNHWNMANVDDLCICFAVATSSLYYYVCLQVSFIAFQTFRIPCVNWFYFQLFLAKCNLTFKSSGLCH